MQPSSLHKCQRRHCAHRQALLQNKLGRERPGPRPAPGPYAGWISSRSPIIATASASAQAPRPEARSPMRASPRLSCVRLKIAASRRFVRVDDRRLLPIFQTVQRLAEKASCRLGISCRREIEVDRVSKLVERPVKIGPFAAHFDVSLIDPPARRARATPLPAQPLFDLRRVPLNPAIDRGMIYGHAALAQSSARDRDSGCHSGSTNAPPRG